MQDQRRDLVVAIVAALHRHALKGGTALGAPLVAKRAAETFGVEGVSVPGFTRAEMAKLVDGRTKQERQRKARDEHAVEAVRAALDAVAPEIVRTLRNGRTNH